jgi:hypothetical protein
MPYDDFVALVSGAARVSEDDIAFLISRVDAGNRGVVTGEAFAAFLGASQGPAGAS